MMSGGPSPITGQVVLRVREGDRQGMADAVRQQGYAPVDKPEPGSSPTAIIVDPIALAGDGLARIHRAALAYPRAPLMILSGPLEKTQLAELLETTNVAALIARDTRDRDAEIDLALRTVTATRESIPFGADTLVRDATTRYTKTLAGSDERDALVDHLEGFLADAGIRQRMVRIAVDAIEELVTNALYDAPVDRAGRRVHAELDRKTAVHLPDAARPRLEVVVNGARVGASMIDPHGSLELATVRRFLAAGLRGTLSDKPGGAGLGFGRIYALVDRLVVRVVAKVRTETAFVLDTSGPRKDPAARPSGFLGVQA